MVPRKRETKDILVRRKAWERLKIEATKRETSILDLATELLEGALNRNDRGSDLTPKIERAKESRQ